MTAPILLSLMNADSEEKEFWTRTIGEKDQSESDFQKAQDIIRNHDAIAQSLALAGDYSAKARLALAEAPDHPLRALLDQLADYAVTREN